MRVLVTGGLGFQGSHLCRTLSEDRFEVTALSTLSAKAKTSEQSSVASRVVWGSVTDKDLVRKTVREHDLVYHLAANIHVDESRRDPEAYTRVNILGTENVARSCVEFGVPLVHVSSCEVYGGSALPITEDFPLCPRSPYAASKAGADCLVQSYKATYELKALVLRPSNIFGPRQKSGAIGAVIPRFIEAALDNEPLTIYGNGQQSRDYTYVGDLVQAYKELGLLLMEKGDDLSCVFNIGSGEDITVEFLANTIVEELGSNSSLVYSEARPGEVQRFCLDSSLLKKYVAWNPQSLVHLQEYLQGFRICS
jgi:dTDP-glucose 4,6-dehydratase